MNYGGSLNLSQFESAYLNVIGSACRAAQFGFPTLQALLQALPCTVILKETRSKKKVLHLNKKLASKLFCEIQFQKVIFWLSYVFRHNFFFGLRGMLVWFVNFFRCWICTTAWTGFLIGVPSWNWLEQWVCREWQFIDEAESGQPVHNRRTETVAASLEASGHQRVVQKERECLERVSSGCPLAQHEQGRL